MKSKALLIMCAAFLLLTMGPLPTSGERPEKMELKPVLLVIDVQNVWLPRMAKEDTGSAPEKINELIALFREYGHPIIKVYHTDPKMGPKPDTKPFEFPDSIAVADDDIKIVKNHSSSFTKTDLENVIREAGRNTVFLCGLSATGCVLATYFGATDRDFIAVMVEGTLMSHDASYTKVIEDICASMTIDEVKETLKDPYL